jgi:hypothetical protein
MESLFEIFHYHPIITLLQTAFMVWMLVDAYRRGAEYYWFWVILFLPGIGSWVYFFVVKVQSGDFANLSLGGWFHRGPSLDQLRYQADQTPTMANHLALGERLVELGRHDEAVPNLEAALKTEPDHGMALFCLATCYKALGRPTEAVSLLERLHKRDPRWGDYAALRLLIEVRDEIADHAGTLENCRELVRRAPTLQHRCLLAERLLEEGQTKEARILLDQALRDHDYAPGHVRRRNGRWIGQARRLAREAAANE